MEARQTPQRSATRVVAIAAVCLLLVVAIAGIVLARRSAPKHPPGPVTAVAAQRLPFGTGAPSTPRAAPAPTPSANEVLFTAGSSILPADAGDSLARFLKSTRGLEGKIRMTARFVNGADKARDVALAKTRVASVRQQLQLSGVKPEQFQSELIEMPAGLLSERDANRIELSLR